MKINDLKIECNEKGTTVTVWAKCNTKEDIDTIIAWLQLAKTVMLGWGGTHNDDDDEDKVDTEFYEMSK